MRKRVFIGSVAALAAVGGLFAVGAIKAWLPGPLPERAGPVGPVEPGGGSDPGVTPVASPGAGSYPGGPAGSRVDPKPRSEAVNEGLAYLVNQQRSDGGWGQGGGWRTDGRSGRVEGTQVEDLSDVGNTCIAALALLRAGNTPKEGPYAKNVARAIEFICKHVREADDSSLYVTAVRNTQLQSKIGPYIDTFLATLVLAEAKGRMPDDRGERTLLAALDKTVRKMEKNQKADGTWANEGWAAVISQGIATKGLNRAQQNGVRVSDEVLARAGKWGKDRFEAGSRAPGSGAGAAAAGPGDAGVALYAQASAISASADGVANNRARAIVLTTVAENPSAPPQQRDTARKELRRFGEAEETLQVQGKALAVQLNSEQFVAGFGSNGGEEFLSYMSISETLLAKGGEEWEKWDKRMAEGLTRAQDKDGSWSGHHCITGKTFCTSAALLVLMADRAPIAVAAELKEGK